MHAGEQVGIDNVGRLALRDHVLVILHRAGFLRGDEGAADIAEIGAHRLGGEHGFARGDRSGQRQRAIEPFADFTDQRERAGGAGMAARTGSNGDQAIGALFHGLFGELVVDDVVHDDAAIAVNGLVHVFTRAQRRDDHRHLVFHAQRQIVHQPIVGTVDDEVDGIGRIIRAKFGRQALQPFFELGQWPGVEAGEAADDAGAALRHDQFRTGDDEQRRTDHRDRQAASEGGRNGHANSPQYDGEMFSRGGAGLPPHPRRRGKCGRGGW